MQMFLKKSCYNLYLTQVFAAMQTTQPQQYAKLITGHSNFFIYKLILNWNVFVPLLFCIMLMANSRQHMWSRWSTQQLVCTHTHTHTHTHTNSGSVKGFSPYNLSSVHWFKLTGLFIFLSKLWMLIQFGSTVFLLVAKIGVDLWPSTMTDNLSVWRSKFYAKNFEQLKWGSKHCNFMLCWQHGLKASLSPCRRSPIWAHDGVPDPKRGIIRLHGEPQQDWFT